MTSPKPTRPAKTLTETLLKVCADYDDETVRRHVKAFLLARGLEEK